MLYLFQITPGSPVDIPCFPGKFSHYYGECTYDKFDVSGGKLDARMTCNIPGQGSAVMLVNGAATTTGSDVTVSMEMSGGSSPMGNMKMKMHMTSERVGDCTA